jgi:uncharacterized protein (DUF885 family)
VSWPWAVLALATLAFVGCGDADQGPREAGSGAAVGVRASSPEASELIEIVETYYDEYLALNPWTATAQGDRRFDDRFGDYVTLGWMADSLAIEQQALERLRAVKRGKLRGEDVVTFEAFERGRELNIEGFRFPSELLPVQQFSNLASAFAVEGSGRGVHTFRSARDYDNFLARMDGFAAWVDHSIENMRAGVAKGVVQPRVVVERTLPQLTAQLVDDPTQSVFWQPILNFPAGIHVADRQRLIEAYRGKIVTVVLPAYQRLRDYLQGEYLPRARASIGMSELPNGVAWYAYLVRYHTTTSLTPDQVHELGLAEVARIRAEMERVKNEVGHDGDLRSFLEALRTDPRFQFTDPAELLAGYRALRQRVESALPLLFAVRPQAGYEIRAVEGFRAPTEASASYRPPSADGNRPGVFYVNTYALASRPSYAMEALFLHEAVPGHHLQIAVAQEATGLPRFRRFAWDTAYGEGWALYAESLGRDLGLYTDPYSTFGALSTEMWRAVRLVVDTGIHAKGWTRDQALDFFRANTALGEADIAAEVDRYIAWPGQALAYKVGQLEIRRLRERARQVLGARFDVRAFHSQVLEGGSLPLAVLEAKIERWIAGR